MHAPRLARLVGAAILAMLLVLPATGVAGAATPTTATPLPEIKLGCALVVPNPLSPTFPNRAVVCRWAPPDGVAIRAYRVWRAVDAGPRQLLATIPSGAPHRYADFAIRSGHAYHYVVVGLGPDGSRVARSHVVTVRVGRPVEFLRFNCLIIIDGAHRGVQCRWSDALRPAARRYVLWRSVDGAAREAIYRTGEDGRRSFFDTDVKPGQHIRYAVVALDANGRIVSFGGPDRVLIPSWTLAAR
jgi:hypothetical protein